MGWTRRRRWRLILAPVWHSLAAQEGGFPTRPLSAGTVAAGSGFAASYLTHPETGLRGYGLTAGFTALLPMVLSVWKYEVAGLFDEALLLADPGLGSLGIFTTGLDLAIAGRIGPIDPGAGSSVEFQHHLTTEAQRFGSRLGVAFDRSLGLLAVSWAGTPATSPVSGLGAGTARATGVLRPRRAGISLQVCRGRVDTVGSTVLGGLTALTFGMRW